MIAGKFLNLLNVEHDLSLAALVAGTVKISWTSLSSSDTNCFWDAFNNEIIVIASFIATCFSSAIWVKFFSRISNLNLCRSLLKKKSFNEVFFSEIYYEYSWKLFQLLYKKMVVVFLNCRYKFYRSFFFLIMTRNFSFSR